MTDFLEHWANQSEANAKLVAQERLKTEMTESAATYQPDPKPGRLIVLHHVMNDVFQNSSASLQLMADLRERAEFGKEKYGTYLQTHNGRDAMMDAYQELLDAVMYIRQASLENPENTEIEGLYGQTLKLARTISTFIRNPK